MSETRKQVPMANLLGLIGDPSKVTTPRPLYRLQRSKYAALVWTAMRVWLGIMWLQAGISKLWGAESTAFLHGAGVKGFASHGVPAYSWWGSFLHSFVVPNAGWIGVLVAVGEFAIGAGLVVGFLTPIASIASLALLFTYVMSGTASVSAFYALFAVVLLVMWPTSSWIGVDGLISGYRQRRDATRTSSGMTSLVEPTSTIIASDAGSFEHAPDETSSDVPVLSAR